MALEQTDMDPSRRWLSAAEVDWDAAYADQLPRIYNYFRFRLGHDANVEDLTSRTFEKAWSARERYRRDLSGFSTWLFHIAQNVCGDYLRARRPRTPLETALDLATEVTPEADAAHQSDLVRLALLTTCLPERERELLALKYGAAISIARSPA